MAITAHVTAAVTLNVVPEIEQLAEVVANVTAPVPVPPELAKGTVLPKVPDACYNILYSSSIS